LKRPTLYFQDQIALIALMAGLPATAIALHAIWQSLDSSAIRVALTLVLLLCWVGGALWLRRRLTTPLQTTANLVEAVRYGDYSMRGRRARRGDALGEILIEINALGQTLSRERLTALEAGALVRAILAEIDTAVFAFDAANRLQLVNRAGAELMARSAESLAGLSPADLGLKEFLAAGSGQQVTTAACQFPGRSGRFEIHHRTFREEGVAHDLIVVTDVSRALRDEERQAWQKLIRVLGHEINNSLTPIKSLAQTLRGMLASSPPADGARDIDASLQIMGDRAEALSRFVATYSQLAKLSAPVRRPLDLRQTLIGVLAIPEYRRVRLIDGATVIVDGDAGQLAQVFINLVRNACEATESSNAAVEVGLGLDHGQARIEIRDEGQGVANPANLFVPFFTTKPGGSGIGLTLSRQIIEAHDGQLLLENRTDRTGCTATVLLPGGRAAA
jgi:two-component system, NtrC family, nitrogen regulation sensor histidine kinase NtrY